MPHAKGAGGGEPGGWAAVAGVVDGEHLRRRPSGREPQRLPLAGAHRGVELDPFGRGVGVADVLFGDYNPAGKLTISFPRSVGQLPLYYNRKPTARRGYLFANKEPLFPFGFGLSYTTFAYSNLKVSPARIGPRDNATVSVTVTNTGKRAGDEIVQLYIRDLVSSVTRPIMELKDFKRIPLAAGESKTVEFVITPDKLSFLDLNLKSIVEPGWFDIMVGTSSIKYDTVKLEVTQGSKQ